MGGPREVVLSKFYWGPDRDSSGASTPQTVVLYEYGTTHVLLKFTIVLFIWEITGELRVSVSTRNQVQRESAIDGK